MCAMRRVVVEGLRRQEGVCLSLLQHKILPPALSKGAFVFCPNKPTRWWTWHELPLLPVDPCRRGLTRPCHPCRWLNPMRKAILHWFLESQAVAKEPFREKSSRCVIVVGMRHISTCASSFLGDLNFHSVNCYLYWILGHERTNSHFWNSAFLFWHS